MKVLPPIRERLQLTAWVLVAALIISLALAPQALGVTQGTFTITATAGPGGTISPSRVVLPVGGCQNFTITPNAGFSIAEVFVDNARLVNPGPALTLCITAMTNRTIEARFVVIPTFNITASAGPGGSISPSGAASVRLGASQVFTITPDAGFIISDVLVDGTSVGAVSTFTFTNVNAAHTIEGRFFEVFPAIAPALQLILD